MFLANTIKDNKKQFVKCVCVCACSISPFMPKITLDDIYQAIPRGCFAKNTLTSLSYLITDLAILSTAPWVYTNVVANTWNPIVLLAYWNFYGFFMWCLFAVGHDCGHGTFSNTGWVNAFCGHVAHTPLLVPFWPWARSHRMHHHKSHPWLIINHNRALYKSIVAPFVMFPMHIIFSHLSLSPFGSNMNHIECICSTLAIVNFLQILANACDYNWHTFALAYGGCYFCFSFWVFMVMYMQQHHNGSGSGGSDSSTIIVYNDKTQTWSTLSNSFLHGGLLQSVDRTYGWGLDRLQHHITDGHMAHRMFPLDIPHYHLRRATRHVRQKLKAHCIPQKDKVVHQNPLDALIQFWCMYLNEDCNELPPIS